MAVFGIDIPTANIMSFPKQELIGCGINKGQEIFRSCWSKNNKRGEKLLLSKTHKDTFKNTLFKVPFLSRAFTVSFSLSAPGL